MHEQAQRTRDRHRRIRWAKVFLRPLPRRATLHNYPVVKWFAAAARQRPYLWTFRASAMAPAFYAGTVLALQPLYGVQIGLAVALAFLLRANLPTMVGLQLITNPLTVVPIYGLTYYAGQWLSRFIGHPETVSMIGQKAYSLAIGGLACGLVLGCALDLTYRLLAYEARKHHWRLPRRTRLDESASPAPPDSQEQ